MVQHKRIIFQFGFCAESHNNNYVKQPHTQRAGSGSAATFLTAPFRGVITLSLMKRAIKNTTTSPLPETQIAFQFKTIKQGSAKNFYANYSTYYADTQDSSCIVFCQCHHFSAHNHCNLNTATDHQFRHSQKSKPIKRIKFPSRIKSVDIVFLVFLSVLQKFDTL